MIWQPFRPIVVAAPTKDQPPVLKMIALQGTKATGFINKSAQALCGWEAGRTFDLWIDYNTGKIGLTVYAPDEVKQGPFVCSARAAKELTAALKTIGAEIGDVFPLRLNEDAQCEMVRYVAQKVRTSA